MRTFAVIPAAGKSRRMGRPKLALPVGDRTVLECVVRALRDAGIDQTLVVLGPHVAELAPVAEAAGAHVLLLKEDTPDMRATVEHGLRWLEDQFQPREDDSWLLAPADHPTLNPQVVRRLSQARRTHPKYDVFVPTYEKRRGHPTLLGWGHMARLRDLPPGAGLNVYLRQDQVAVFEVAWDDASILADLDTPEDYARLLNAQAAEPRV